VEARVHHLQQARPARSPATCTEGGDYTYHCTSDILASQNHVTIIEKLLKPGSKMLDIGAHICSLSLPRYTLHRRPSDGCDESGSE
jgi:hypothetical protein